ncbi:helix-turn-helix domain-containing protein [Paenibacillus septentrionalis]|uniref:Helix-turn-helix domain-containing protein n=1 Tax=Paenibacillus septentrionalis TaxID=429342 RepID=A0ABW1V6Q0_9BACL
MDNLSNMGKKIAQLRKSHGMTQEELGKRLSVSAQAVSKWENSDSLPDLSLIVELAKTFDSTTDYLLGQEGGLATLLPQIRDSFANMSTDEKISFLGEIITVAEPIIPRAEPEPSGHPSLVHIHLGPTGMGLWAKDRLACILTTPFLKEAIETLQENTEFPLNLIPREIVQVLFALLRDMNDLRPDYAIDEKTLRASLQHIANLEQILAECIELGFVDRVRGGYRLNYKADLVVRLLALVHQTTNKHGTINVVIGR